MISDFMNSSNGKAIKKKKLTPGTKSEFLLNLLSDQQESYTNPPSNLMSAVKKVELSINKI